MIRFLIDCILLFIAWVLILPVSVTNYFFVSHKKGYFRNTALNLDIFANNEYRALWNKVLIIKEGYQFGKEGETISSALGKNILIGALTKTGKVLVFLLTEKHCTDSIKE